MNYTFWIETDAGAHMAWRGLTKQAAQAMYRTTLKHPPPNLIRYGWGEES